MVVIVLAVTGVITQNKAYFLNDVDPELTTVVSFSILILI